jgi:hypothetical protein
VLLTGARQVGKTTVLRQLSEADRLSQPRRHPAFRRAGTAGAACRAGWGDLPGRAVAPAHRDSAIYPGVDDLIFSPETV